MILTYKRLHSVSRQEQVRANRKLFGYTDKSHNGHYEYERPGLLSQFSFERLGPGVLRVEEKDAVFISMLLKKEGLHVEEK